jgi:hypothetical protein
MSRGLCGSFGRRLIIERSKDGLLITAACVALQFALRGDGQLATDQAIGILSSNWLQVAEQTTCEAMQDEYCLGRYGFTIHRDGTFLAGPSGEGEKTEGRISSKEVQQLDALMQPISPDALASQMTCETGGLPGIKDQVDVTFVDESVVRIYDLGGSLGQLCYRGSRADIERLHNHLRMLMTRYYPIPFPKR